MIVVTTTAKYMEPSPVVILEEDYVRALNSASDTSLAEVERPPNWASCIANILLLTSSPNVIWSTHPKPSSSTSFPFVELGVGTSESSRISACDASRLRTTDQIRHNGRGLIVNPSHRKSLIRDIVPEGRHQKPQERSMQDKIPMWVKGCNSVGSADFFIVTQGPRIVSCRAALGSYGQCMAMAYS